MKQEEKQEITSAKAEAEALRMQKQEISSELVQLKQIEVQRLSVKKWDGKLPYATNSITFLNLPDAKSIRVEVSK